MGLFGSNLFQNFNCVFLPTFFDFVDYLWLLLENSSFKNLCRIHCLGGNSVQYSRIKLTITKTMKKVISTENRVFMSLVGPSETGKYNLFTIGSRKEPFNQKLTKFPFFINTLGHFLMLCKKGLKILSLFKV